METSRHLENLAYLADEAVDSHRAGRDGESQTAVAQMTSEITAISLEGWQAAPTQPPDPQPGGGDWEIEETADYWRATLADWLCTEDDLQRRLALADLAPGQSWDSIEVAVDFVPAQGWAADTEANYSGGQLTRGPLSGDYSWQRDLLGFASIRATRHVRFTAAFWEGGLSGSQPRPLHGENRYRYVWSSSKLAYNVASVVGSIESLPDHGDETVFVIGNDADGEIFSVGWRFTVVVTAHKPHL